MSDQPAGHQVNNTATAGVIARPPLLFLAALLLGLAWDHVLPAPFVIAAADLLHWIISGLLILFGLAFFGAGIRNFSRASTPVPTYEPVRALVTTGTAGPATRSISACFSSMVALASPHEALGS